MLLNSPGDTFPRSGYHNEDRSVRHVCLSIKCQCVDVIQKCYTQWKCWHLQWQGVTHNIVGTFEWCSSVATMNSQDKGMEFGRFSEASPLYKTDKQSNNNSEFTYLASKCKVHRREFTKPPSWESSALKILLWYKWSSHSLQKPGSSNQLYWIVVKLLFCLFRENLTRAMTHNIAANKIQLLGADYCHD